MNFKLVDRILPDFDPEKYVVDDGLHQAAEVAFALRQPLLIMGEPGTGKTKFAYKLAHELAKPTEAHAYKFLAKPLVFNTKTSSVARDLFYTYDSLAHFQSANIRRDINQAAPATDDFIKLEALGQAIAQTNPGTVAHPKLAKDLRPEAWSSVVLIDEIDKAPRDFPNDILNEIENQEFFVRELGSDPVKRAAGVPIMVVMTSNSEKNLPDAFLRRCVFYHIPFPDTAALLKIANTSLGEAAAPLDKNLERLINLFEEVRKKAARKAPGTAEMLAWLRIIGLQNIQDFELPENKIKMKDNLGILIKTKEDYEAVKDVFKN
ncbi:MAG: MoxR family ATPase [Saprospiraceae bacterium]